MVEPDTAVKHNAKFSRNVTDEITLMVQRLRVEGVNRVLDPMGGVGGIFDLHSAKGAYQIDMVEIELEWARAAREHPLIGSFDTVYRYDFLEWAGNREIYWLYDFVITSPTYGNRMADHHDAKDGSKRNTYKHTLGRDLSEGSSAGMQWGDEYRNFHDHAWNAVWDLLAWGGYFIVNVKDHIRKGEKQPVSVWHRELCKSIGFDLEETHNISVRGNRQGANGDVRVDNEQIYVFRKPGLT